MSSNVLLHILRSSFEMIWRQNKFISQLNIVNQVSSLRVTVKPEIFDVNNFLQKRKSKEERTGNKAQFVRQFSF